jgi:hypothetical protein
MIVFIRRRADCQLGDEFRVVGRPRRWPHVGGADVAGSAALSSHSLSICSFVCLIDVGQGGTYTGRVGAVALVAVGAFADDAGIDVSGVRLEGGLGGPGCGGRRTG